MTKQELIDRLALQHKDRNLSKAAASDIVESLMHQLTFALKRKKRMSYPGFGTFLVRKRKSRKGRNPQTGEAIDIDAFKTVIFRPSVSLKEKLNS